MTNEKNKDLVAFAAEAKRLGLSYGQLQQMETVKLIREGKLEPKKRKKKR